jgi:hypothetical protein
MKPHHERPKEGVDSMTPHSISVKAVAETPKSEAEKNVESEKFVDCNGRKRVVCIIKIVYVCTE